MEKEKKRIFEIFAEDVPSGDPSEKKILYSWRFDDAFADELEKQPVVYLHFLKQLMRILAGEVE